MIKIEQKLNPFSISPGVILQIPGSHLFCKVFPSLIQILDEDANVISEQFFSQNLGDFFCVMQDLHKVGVKVYLGKDRYWITPKGEIKEGKSLSYRKLFSSEFLHLGMNRKLDWEMIYRRRNLLEFIPLWFRLGVLTPEVNLVKKNQGEENIELFSFMKEKFFHEKIENGYYLLQKLFFSCFPFNLVPSYQNIYLPKLNKIHHLEIEGYPVFLVKEGASFIKSLFIKIQNNIFYILPFLLPEFHSGRMINILCDHYGFIDFIWSKKTIRKIIFRSNQNATIKFIFPKNVSKFRLGILGDKKKYFLLVNSFIEIELGNIYILDCFQK